jgi:hypothetical protein
MYHCREAWQFAVLITGHVYSVFVVHCLPKPPRSVSLLFYLTIDGDFVAHAIYSSKIQLKAQGKKRHCDIDSMHRYDDAF